MNRNAEWGSWNAERGMNIAEKVNGESSKRKAGG